MMKVNIMIEYKEVEIILLGINWYNYFTLCYTSPIYISLLNTLPLWKKILHRIGIVTLVYYQPNMVILIESLLLSYSYLKN
jgi:hypothetical protein